MRPERQPRKLAVLFSASAEGYGRLVQRDDALAVGTLRERARIIEESVERYRGRVVESTTGGVLADFPSVGDALSCAIETQRELGTRDAAVPDDRRITFRIGIHLGEVVEEGGRIYGEGVHVAALVAGLADPGGICLSRTAREHVKSDLGVGFADLGNHDAEDVSEPVRVCRVVLEPETPARRIGRLWSRLRRRQKIGLALAVALAQGAGGLLVKRYVDRPAPAASTAAQQPTSAAPSLGERSIAVLPFDNMSGDPEQAYFADGFAEQLITTLSKVPGLGVASRNSSFTYRGKQAKIPDIARELGVQYVLEGSVQKAANRIRVNVQLIDGTSGQHVWADSYDRELKDIFALQDELILKVLPPLRVGLRHPYAGSTAERRAGTNNVDAYLKLVGCSYWASKGTREGIAVARRAAEEALALDPEYATAYFCLGSVHFWELYYGASRPGEGVKSAIALLEKALSMDGSLSAARARLGLLYELIGRYEEGIAEAQKAVELPPADASTYYNLANVLKYARRYQEAIAANEQALRLEPTSDLIAVNLASLYFLAGDCRQALATDAKRPTRERDSLAAHVQSASTYAGCGKEREAKAEAAEVLRINPKFTVARWIANLPYRNPSEKERFAAGLRTAGLP